MSKDRWPRVGDIMRFTGKNGWDHNQEQARKVMEIGGLLTVSRCRVGGFSHTIDFVEYPGKSWNGVMFEFTEPEQLDRPGPEFSYRTIGQALDATYPFGYRSEDKEP